MIRKYMNSEVIIIENLLFVNSYKKWYVVQIEKFNDDNLMCEYFIKEDMRENPNFAPVPIDREPELVPPVNMSVMSDKFSELKKDREQLKIDNLALKEDICNLQDQIRLIENKRLTLPSVTYTNFKVEKFGKEYFIVLTGDINDKHDKYVWTNSIPITKELFKLLGGKE